MKWSREVGLVLYVKCTSSTVTSRVVVGNKRLPKTNLQVEMSTLITWMRSLQSVIRLAPVHLQPHILSPQPCAHLAEALVRDQPFLQVWCDGQFGVLRIVNRSKSRGPV